MLKSGRLGIQETTRAKFY